MTFRVGQKVVCVDDEFVAVCRGRATLPRRGKTYTVRNVFTYSQWTAIRLVEIKNKAVAFYNDDTGETVEAAFPTWRFRPAVEPKAEVSFTTGADPDSEQYDNRRRIPVSEWGCSA